MTAARDQASQIDGVAPLLQAGRERARELGRAVLVSRTMALPDDAPDAIFASATDYFLWQQPSRGLSLLALGEAVRLVAEGSERFGVIRERLACIQADALIEREAGVAAAPLCLAGFAFDVAGPEDEAWGAFPEGLAVVPRLLFIRRAGRASLTLNVMIDAESDIEAEVASLLAEAEHALAGVPQTGEQAIARATESDIEFRRWREDVRDLTARIAQDAAQKVVLARRLQVSASQPFDVQAVLDRLRQRYPDCTVFAVGNASGCFLGATPETLLRLHGHEVSTDCLAGSARRGRDDAEDAALGEALLADDKERREHALVTWGITEALQDVCREIDVPETPVLRRTANVQHLHTPIRAAIDADRHVLDLVERLHPTPATAGLPRAKSLCLIREHERFSRGWYAGPIGWIDADGGGEFAVALRSGLVRGDSAYLYAGCGIVTGSDPQREYEESRVKLQAMLWALNATT